MVVKTPLKVVVISRGKWGLGQDSRIIEQVLREANLSGTRIDTVEHIDAVNFLGSKRIPEAVDINIHLEVPCRAAWPWAKYNIVVVNQEWWYKDEWSWVLEPINSHGTGGADLFVFKSQYASNLFPTVKDRSVVIPWRCPSVATKKKTKAEFLYLVGASINKMKVAKQICAYWRDDWPVLTVVCSSDVLLEEFKDSVKTNIVIRGPFETDAARIEAQSEYAYHVVASAAEGFGYTFAECAATGALPLWTDIPVYKELWGDIMGDIGLIKTIPLEIARMVDNTTRMIKDAEALETAVNSLLTCKNVRALSDKLKASTNSFRSEFRNKWRHILKMYKPSSSIIVPPPPPNFDDLPHVGIITVTCNRPEWFVNMVRNIVQCGYPASKFTWVIVDDGDPVGGKRLDEQVMKFSAKNPMIDVKYKSLVKKHSIGAKRNIGIKEAPEKSSVFVMMDDDDHYPEGNIALRVAWLKSTGVGCAYCSTLPMYDCRKYISAMNVPPLDLTPSDRVSEATLAFTRDFWSARGFPEISISEGSEFISGRISDTVEIPPAGVIVSFIHGCNSTSRRVPEGEPNGCHYGFSDEYFKYISEIGLKSMV
jgi:hypothetical protein